MTLDRVLSLARKHLGSGSMESSARLCLNYAVTAKDDGKMEEARWWAARSIAYSVGVFHPDYVKSAPATSIGV